MAFILWLIASFGPAALGRSPDPESVRLTPRPASREPVAPKVRSSPTERPLSIDFGAGVPNLLNAGAQIRVRRWLQIGASYGIFPGSWSVIPNFRFEGIDVKLADGISYRLQPRDSSSLNTIHPFVRFFPFPDRDQFYVQFSYTLFRIQSNIETDLITQNQTIPSAINFKILFTQPIPAISVGHLFMGTIYFANISIGAAFLANAYSNIETSTLLPDSLGGAANNQEPVVRARAEVEASTAKVSEELRKQVFLIPTIALTFGIIF